jgi:hypothetical protein
LASQILLILRATPGNGVINVFMVLGITPIILWNMFLVLASEITIVQILLVLIKIMPLLL